MSNWWEAAPLAEPEAAPATAEQTGGEWWEAAPLADAEAPDARTGAEQAMTGFGDAILDKLGPWGDTIQANIGDEGKGRIGSSLLGAFNGITFGFGDEALGVVDPKLKQGLRDGNEMSLDANPVTHIASEIGGAAVTGKAAANRYTAAAASPLGVVKAGAIGGGVFGAGEAEGGLKERAKGGAIGTAFGYVGGRGADMLGSFASSLANRIKNGKPQGIEELGIPLTRGQQTDDAALQSFEQAAFRGGKTPEAQQVMRPFMQDQQEAVVTAGRGLAGDSYANVNEAGAVVKEGLTNAARTAQQEIDAAYDAARGFGAKMKAEGVEALPNAVRENLPDDVRFLMDEPTDASRRSFPAATSAIEALDRLKAGVTNTNAKAGSEGRVTALDFRRIEQARREINTAIGTASSGSDKRASTAVKRSFDAYMERALDDALFEGDEAFLAAFKRARGLRADFAKNFEANRVMEKIVDGDMDEVQTLRYLLGASKVQPSERTAKVIPQLKEALGADSEAFGALREAAMKRVMEQTEKTYSPKVLYDNLGDALEGKNAPVFRELLTAEELGQMKRYRAIVKKLIPAEGSVNYSNTAYETARQAADTLLAKARGNMFGRIGLGTIEKLMPDLDAQKARASLTRLPPPPQAPRITSDVAPGVGVGVESTRQDVFGGR